MVDAISSFNANKPVNPKKDLTINWNKLTVNQIKEYESDGQEVPDYIKKWADYIEHMESVPDDVTYATYYNIDANNIKYQHSVHTTSDPTNSIIAGLNPSSSTQSEVYGKLCKDTITNIKTITQQLDQIMDNAEKEVAEAEASKEGICDRIQTLQQRASQLKSDKKDPLAPMEIVDINNQIKAAGEGGINTMDLRLISLQTIGADVNDAYELIRGAGSLSATAATFARDFGSFSIATLKYSKELKELSKEKGRDIKSANKQQENNITTVEGYKGNVATSANKFIPPGAEIENNNTGNINDSNNNESGAQSSAKADEKAAEKKEKQTKTSAKSRAEKTKTLADEKILTDPNEILKRKLKRGEA